MPPEIVATTFTGKINLIEDANLFQNSPNKIRLSFWLIGGPTAKIENPAAGRIDEFPTEHSQIDLYLFNVTNYDQNEIIRKSSKFMTSGSEKKLKRGGVLPDLFAELFTAALAPLEEEADAGNLVPAL